MRRLVAAAVAVCSLAACGSGPSGPAAPTPSAGDPRLHRVFDLPADLPFGHDLAGDLRARGVWYLATGMDGRPAAAHWDAATGATTMITLRGYHDGGTLAADPDGALWIAGGSGVTRVDPVTRLTKSWWAPSPGRGLPDGTSDGTLSGVAPDGHGRLAFAYSGVGGVVVLDPSTGFSTTPVPGLDGASAVALAGDGTLAILGRRGRSQQPNTLVLLGGGRQARRVDVQGTVLRPERAGFVVGGAAESVEVTTGGAVRPLHLGSGLVLPLRDGRYAIETPSGLAISTSSGADRRTVDFPVLCCTVPMGDDTFDSHGPPPTPPTPVPYRVLPDVLTVDGTGLVWMTVLSPVPRVLTLDPASV